MAAFPDDEPVFQATNAATDRAPVAPAQLVAIQLGHDLHDAPINRVALTDQLRQLVEQHLKTLIRAHTSGAGRCGRRHDFIIAATYDKSGPPDPPQGCALNHLQRGTRQPLRLFTMHTLATRPHRPEFSAQIPTAQTEKQQLNPLRLPRTPNREPSQDLRPDDTTVVANWLGVDRGTDLIGYVLIIAFVFTTLSTYMRFKELELRYARLARAIALQGARVPDDG